MIKKWRERGEKKKEKKKAMNDIEGKACKYRKE
jgi:hypothetical protein